MATNGIAPQQQEIRLTCMKAKTSRGSGRVSACAHMQLVRWHYTQGKQPGIATGTHILQPDAQVAEVLLVLVLGQQLLRAALQQGPQLAVLAPCWVCELHPLDQPARSGRSGCRSWIAQGLREAERRRAAPDPGLQHVAALVLLHLCQARPGQGAPSGVSGARQKRLVAVALWDSHSRRPLVQAGVCCAGG